MPARVLRVKVAPVQHWWPVARALLISAALIVGGLSGIPDSPERWMRSAPPIVRQARELLDWVRSTLTAPVRFVPNVLQFSQHWKLFSSTSDVRFLMWVEGRATASDPWQTLYRPHDDAHTWQSEALEYRRTRGNWNPSRRGPNRGYDGFVTWVARRVFEEHPAFGFVRVRMEEIELQRNSQGFRATGRFFHERVRERGEVMQ